MSSSPLASSPPPAEMPERDPDTPEPPEPGPEVDSFSRDDNVDSLAETSVDCEDVNASDTSTLLLKLTVLVEPCVELLPVWATDELTVVVVVVDGVDTGMVKTVPN